MPERIDTEWVLWRWTRDEEGEPIHCSECHKGYGAEKEHLPWCKVGALAQEFADRKTAQIHIEALEKEVDASDRNYAALLDTFAQAQAADRKRIEALEGVVREKEKRYPVDAGCTRHMGESWPCKKCAAIKEKP